METFLKETMYDIQQFKKRFPSEAHFIFICHAAFPVALTVDLLEQLWLNFRGFQPIDNAKTKQLIPHIVISDLLLSNLCYVTQADLFEMDSAVRGYLLDTLKKDERFGQERIEALAEFLLFYANEKLNREATRTLYEAQFWTALSTLSPQNASSKLASALKTAVENKEDNEIVRLSNLVSNFKYQDTSFNNLINFSKGLEANVYGDYVEDIQKDYFDKVLTISDDPNGIKIPLPDDLADLVDFPVETVEEEEPKDEMDLIPKLQIAFVGNEKGVRYLTEAYHANPTYRKDFRIELIDSEALSDFVFYVDDENQCRLILPYNYDRPWFEQMYVTDKSSAISALNKLKYVGKWFYIQQMIHPNPDSELDLEGAIEVKFEYEGKQLDFDRQEVSYVSIDMESRKNQPKLYITIRNKRKQELYVALLFLSNQMGVFSLLEGKNASRIYPKEQLQALNGKPVSIALNDYLIDFNWEEDSNRIKLLISETPFEVLPFLQDELRKPFMGGTYQGLDKTQADALPNWNVDNQWATNYFELKVKNPYFKGEAPKQPIDFGKKLFLFLFQMTDKDETVLREKKILEELLAPFQEAGYEMLFQEYRSDEEAYEILQDLRENIFWLHLACMTPIEHKEVHAIPVVFLSGIGTSYTEKLTALHDNGLYTLITSPQAITGKVCIDFSKLFYPFLFEGNSIKMAYTKARKTLEIESTQQDNYTKAR